MTPVLAFLPSFGGMEWIILIVLGRRPDGGAGGGPAAAAADRGPGPEVRDATDRGGEAPVFITTNGRALNSAARVPSSHGGSHWFESSSAHSLPKSATSNGCGLFHFIKSISLPGD